MVKRMQSEVGEPVKEGRTCILRRELAMYLAVGVFCPRFWKQRRVEEERVKERPLSTL